MKIYDARWAKKAEDKDNFRTLIPEPEQALLERSKAKKILDLGSGDGKTLVFLASKGYGLTGIDYSEVGVAKTNASLNENKLKARVVLADIYEPLPFKDGEFDAVISYQVINHDTIEKIRCLLHEVNRVLKKGGLFSVKVADASTYAFTYYDGLCYDEYGSIFQLIAPRTFLPIAGWERGVIHYEFNKEILTKELADAGFVLLDARHIECHLLANFEKR